MKIATYNVNSIGARLPVLLHWLASSKPDVACLQELKAPDEKFPVEAIREAGYEAVWHGQKAWNGVAILARGEKPEETRRGLPGDPDDTHSRYIEAVVGRITVGCLYLPNGNPAPGPKFDYKLKWFERFSAHAAGLLARGGPVVLAGDYNAIPTELDVYKPERWAGDALYLPETREAYRQLLAQGWTDTLRHLHPDEVIYTFWDYMRGAFSRNAGLRIDHLLVSSELAPRLKAAGVDKDVRAMEKTSDHAPTWIEVGAESFYQILSGERQAATMAAIHEEGGVGDMKKSQSKGAESSSKPIDEGIDNPGDWRGELLSRLRALIMEADPGMTEERKWRKPSNPAGVPTWSHKGLVCTGETYKNVVKMTFAKGASLADPSSLFNSSLEGNTRRAIDFREGDKLDEEALKALIRAAVALNTSSARG